MVLDFPSKFPLERVKISRVLVLSGLLTFLYLVEFCIGMRTVYYAFSAWTDTSPRDIRDGPVTWPLCVASLLISVSSLFVINVISAMWEQKQIKEEEKEQSVIRFSLHIVLGGMIWRYICLWSSDKKEFLKKSALLLTIIKFLFTQCFTVPLVIVHFGVLNNVDEVILDVCSVLCINISLLLTCTMFRWCGSEVEELKKWNYETVDLVPLIFLRSMAARRRTTVDNSTEKEIESGETKKSNNKSNNAEMALLNITVLFQTFGFSFGRLLALGVLLKLAGIYAVSIMFLQLLISVIYLKFQAPTIIPETLPKWRQLTRLAFLSYILIFEWQLNRDTKTVIDFRTNMKHSMLYYCIATVESVFYLITWAITASYSSSLGISDLKDPKNRFIRSIITMGTLALILSLTIHIILFFWKSRRMSVFIGSVRRHYLTVKLRMSIYGCKDETKIPPEITLQSSRHVDISSPIPIHRNERADCPQSEEEEGELEKQSSYRDLRDPIDEEIEIYARNKAKNAKNSSGRHCEKIPESVKETDDSDNEVISKTEEDDNRYQSEKLQKFSAFTSRDDSEDCHNAATIPTSPITEINKHIELSAAKAEAPQPKGGEVASPSIKSKAAVISESLSRQWDKFSSMSRKLTDSMQEKIQKRKEQFQNFRSGSAESKSDSNVDPQPKETHDDVMEDMPKIVESPSREYTESPNIESSEGYFVGDSRYQEQEVLQSVTVFKEIEECKRSPKSKTEKLSDDEGSVIEEDSDDGPKHREGDSPCPCYICKTLGDARFRRRRSSSVPPDARKLRQDSSNFTEVKTISHCVSNPNISSCKGVSTKGYENQLKNSRYHSKGVFSKLSVAALNRVEHYV